MVCQQEERGGERVDAIRGWSASRKREEERECAQKWRSYKKKMKPADKRQCRIIM